MPHMAQCAKTQLRFTLVMKYYLVYIRLRGRNMALHLGTLDLISGVKISGVKIYYPRRENITANIP